MPDNRLGKGAMLVESGRLSISSYATRVQSFFRKTVKRDSLTLLSRVNGFWIPTAEEKIYKRYGWIDGLPNQDVVKITKAAELAKNRRCALDIGANIGVTAARLAGYFDTVHAFEPLPLQFEALSRNLEKYPNATPHQCAIGDKPGETYLTFYTKHGQISHVDIGQEKDPQKKSMRVGPIPMRTIDSMNLQGVDLIKIDVEGFETPVVEGAVETIKRCRPIILIEQAGNEEKNFGFRNNQASEILRSLGMTEHPEAWEKMKKDKVFHFPG